MNTRESVLLRRLLAELDYSRLLYEKLEGLLVRPYLKFLVGRIAQSHADIANDLAVQIERDTGRSPHRTPSVVARWRAGIESSMAMIDADLELGCLKRVMRHQRRIAQKFQGLPESVQRSCQDGCRDLCNLEHRSAQIEGIVRQMERHADSQIYKPPLGRAGGTVKKRRQGSTPQGL